MTVWVGLLSDGGDGKMYEPMGDGYKRMPIHSFDNSRRVDWDIRGDWEMQPGVKRRWWQSRPSITHFALFADRDDKRPMCIERLDIPSLRYAGRGDTISVEIKAPSTTKQVPVTVQVPVLVER